MPDLEIDDLRGRWEAERDPALTHQLAGEYERAGDLERALEVLASGLEVHPDDVATRVAKGRCHLELDQADEACRELLRIAMDDPSHQVANRLLVDAHLRLGEQARARDRLDLFELLGGDRSQVEELERRLGSDGRGEAEVPVEPAVAGVFEEVAEGADADPFVLLDWIEFDESRYAAAIFAEGVFSEPRAAMVAAPEPVHVALEAPSEAVPSDESAPTLTLGELYRKQGHHDEAVGIFRQILERQPGNVEAARALGELEKNRDWPLSADDLLGETSTAEPGEERSTGDLLRRYRDRLRSGE